MTAEPTHDQQAARRRMRRLARLLDSSIGLPGGFRIGLDGLIGLVPGIGDTIAAGLSSYIIVEAARLGVPASGLARMVSNVLLELAVGVVPVLGDIFDFVFKANERNVRVVEQHLDQPNRARSQSRAIVFAVAAALLALLVLAAFITISVVQLVWARLTG